MKKIVLAALLMAQLSYGQTPVTVQLQQFANGLVNAVDIAHAGDERLFVVQQPGVIRIVDPSGTVLPTPFLNIQSQVNGGGEKGLLGLAFDPDYTQNGFFYVYYISGSGSGNTRVSRFQVSSDPNVANATSEQVIYTWPQPQSNHNGGDLDFGPDGYLYIGIGDGGGAGDTQGNAQDLSDPLGDIIRIDVSNPDITYAIPPTNPFANASASGDTLPEIWASGLRNPFRWGFDRLTGDLWIGDVGQNAFEEVDFWPAGDNSHPNFGWRCYEANSPFNTAGCLPQSSYVAPVAVHDQSQFGWYSVIGGRVYRGTEFPRLDGRYIYTDYVGGQFYSLVPDGAGGWTRMVLRNVQTSGYTCIAENSVGELFVSKIDAGVIYKIVDPCPQAIPTIAQNGSILTSSTADAYQWFMESDPIAGATDQTFEVTENGSYYVVATVGAGCELASTPVVINVNGLSSAAINGFSVSPVPARDQLSLSGIPENVTNISVVDLTGRTVLTRSSSNIAGPMVLDISTLSNGNYSLVLFAGNGAVIGQQRIAIQR